MLLTVNHDGFHFGSIPTRTLKHYWWDFGSFHFMNDVFDIYIYIAQTLRVKYIYLHMHGWFLMVYVYGKCKDRYTSPMGCVFLSLLGNPHMEVNNMPLKNLGRRFGASPPHQHPPKAGDHGGNIFGNILYLEII